MNIMLINSYADENLLKDKSGQYLAYLILGVEGVRSILYF